MLSVLPVEIIIQIFAYFETAEDFANFSLTCKALHLTVSKVGWKCYVKQRYPDIQVAGPNHSDAAQGLTQLSEAWSRRAVLGKRLEPSGYVYDLIKRARFTRWTKPSGQTMGFQAQIDSYEESTGDSWDARKEVIAYSAGSQLVIGIKDMGPAGRRIWKSSSARDRELEFDNFRHRNKWLVYKPYNVREGQDDILNVNLIRPHQTVSGRVDSFKAIIGNANGELSMISMLPEQNRNSKCYQRISFNTLHNSIKAAHISPSSTPLLAASVSKKTVAIYGLENISSNHFATTQFNVINKEQDASTKCVDSHSIKTIRFISDEIVAIGMTHDADPKIFRLRPEGLTEIAPSIVHNDRSISEDLKNMSDYRKGVSCLAPIPFHSFMGGGNQVFLSSTGKLLRFHDLRSRSIVNLDIIEAGISSLAYVGLGHIAAGAYSSSLRLVDLRKTRAHDFNSSYRKDKWDLLMNLRENRATLQDRRYSNSTSSVIYSLSSPSARSTKVYAGLEDMVVQMDFINAYDRNPDPIFSYGVRKDYGGTFNPAKTYDPGRNLWNFLMHDLHGYRVNSLLKQGPLLTVSENRLKPIDERWHPLIFQRSERRSL